MTEQQRGADMEAIEPDELGQAEPADLPADVIPAGIDLAAHLAATAALWAMRRIAPPTAPMRTKIAVYVGVAVLGAGLAALSRGPQTIQLRGVVHGAGNIMTSSAGGAAMNEAGRAVFVAVMEKRGWRRTEEAAVSPA
jgi:hypothetical protein